jgi:hypothetical protein
MAKKITRQLGELNELNVACLIHDSKYDFQYVYHLYNAVDRHTNPKINFHVFTEPDRIVPKPFIHHKLEEWPGIRGPRASWWYKIQMFNPSFINEQMLYLDLDTVIVNNIDWLWQQKTKYFWTIRDFKYLFKSRRETINSSVMWFNPTNYSHVYHDFNPTQVQGVPRWHGDQDYITEKIPKDNIKFLDQTRILSWKWQVQDGGIDWRTRRPFLPGTGTVQEPHHSIYIFHGKPNPHQVEDPVIREHWR